MKCPREGTPDPPAQETVITGAGGQTTNGAPPAPAEAPLIAAAGGEVTDLAAEGSPRPAADSLPPSSRAETVKVTPPVILPEPGQTVSYVPGAPAPSATVGAEQKKSSAWHFGDYELLLKVARGGMGVVYKARHKKLQRVVALKMILSAHLASDEDVQRFQLEAEAAAQLDHPGIVPIFEVGELEGQHFYSMGFVEGGSLAMKTRGQPLPPREAAELVARTAAAVAYAHDHGIVHRDLKPENILLDKDGHPKITDFGLAKKMSGDSRLTVAGQIIGTPHYMSPEQAAGKTETVGPAADIYSLGAILYFLLTGRPPFEAADMMGTLKKVLEQEPVSPRELNGAVSRDLETICLKCLQKDARRRYFSATALAEDLHHFLNGEPILARPIGRTERLVRWCRRNRGVASLLAAVAASLLIGMATTTYYAFEARDQAREALESARRFQEEKKRSDRRWYSAEITLAHKNWEEAQIAAVLERLESLKPQEPDAPDLRGFEWHYLQRLCRLDLRALAGHSAPVWCVAYSPDGRRLATGGGRYGEPGEVKVWDTVTGRELLSLRSHKDFVSCLAFSPDGRRLAAANGGFRTRGEVRVWDAANGRELLCVRKFTTPIWSVAFRPDGLQLAAAGRGVSSEGNVQPSEVKVFDAADGRELFHLPGGPGFHAGIAYSPDGRRLAVIDNTGVRVCDAATGKEIITLRGHTGAVTTIAYGPDGRLALGDVAGTVTVWDATGGPLPLTLHHTAGIADVAFSPDGRRLASAVNRVATIWDAVTGEVIQALRGHTDTVSAVAFSPNGWQLVSAGADGAVKVWDATTPAATLSLTGPGGRVNDVAFSPDGRRLVAAAVNGTLRVWDTTTALEVLTLRGHASGVNGVAYSPDGQRIASGGGDRTVRVWDATDGSEIACWRGHSAEILAVAFSPDGRRIASTSSRLIRGEGSFSWEVNVCDVSAGKEVLTLRGSTKEDRAPRSLGVAFSPDGERLAAALGSAVRVWDMGGRQLLTLLGHTHAVSRVAFSPDGGRFASASQDGSLKVWDAATGEELRTLRGHTSAVTGVAFSRDGLRIASVGGRPRTGGQLPYEVKIWDALIGQETLTLQGTAAQFPCLAFSLDGGWLAASGDGVVTVWDATSTTAEDDEEREARGLVRFLVAQKLPRSVTLTRIEYDETISDAVRRRALTLAEPYFQEQVRHEAEQLVQAQFNKPLLRPEVLANLRADTALSEDVRQEALAIAERFVEKPDPLNRVSRAVVRRPGAEAAAYHLALRQAEAASRLVPFQGAYHTTLGLAQYRVGLYAEARATLLHAEQVNTADQTPVFADLAFLAMTRHRLGEKDQAKATLDRLREAMKRPELVRNEEAQSFLREAETLLAGQAGHVKALP